MLHVAAAEPAVLIHALARCSRQSSSLAVAMQSQRRPSRGGQDLTHRYRRLEKSIREKNALSQNIADLSSPRPVPNVRPSSATANTDQLRLFRGMPVPQEPKPPDSDGKLVPLPPPPSKRSRRRKLTTCHTPDCCMSGCAVCVYDLYDESLQAYKHSVASLQRSLSALGIPLTDWPPSVRPPSPQQQQQTRNTPNANQVSLDAFEATELALKAKRENGSQGESRR
jgi:Oxidoreductase-like protein, N-terminal